MSNESTHVELARYLPLVEGSVVEEYRKKNKLVTPIALVVDEYQVAAGITNEYKAQFEGAVANIDIPALERLKGEDESQYLCGILLLVNTLMSQKNKSVASEIDGKDELRGKLTESARGMIKKIPEASKFLEVFQQFSFTKALFSKVIARFQASNSHNVLNESSNQWVNPNGQSLNILFHNLTLLKKEIGNEKKFLIVLALHPVEILQLRNKENNKISLAMATFCKNNNIQLLDLSQKFIEKIDFLEYFLPCDGHWSPKGHKFVKDLIIQELNSSTKNKSALKI